MTGSAFKIKTKKKKNARVELLKKKTQKMDKFF